MKCVWVLIIVLVHGAAGVFEDKLLTTLEDARIEGRISNQCNDVLELYLENLNSSTTDEWALKMLDATSKIPVGLIFSYNFGELGEFDQCLDTESLDGSIKGKYCIGSLVLSDFTSNSVRTNAALLRQHAHLRDVSKRIAGVETRAGDTGATSGPTWAICLPSDCTDEDITEILQNLVGSPSATCQTKEDLTPPLTTGAIVTIVVLSYFAFLLVSSTICDLYFNYKNRESPFAILTAFSVYTNGRKLFRMSRNSAELSCLNGIRFFSMLWVIVGHVLTMYVSSPISNFKAILDWADTLDSMIIISATLSVDSFFLIGGALVVYGFMKAKHNGVNFNIVHFYLHRYLRLTPPLAAAILVSANLLNYMGTGPLWGTVDTSYQQVCQQNWWSSLLYIQNYVVDTSYCMAQTWYLSVDMQLYVFSPLLLLPLWRYPKIGVTLVLLSILAFIIVPFSVTYDKQISGVITDFSNTENQLEFWNSYYFKTHTRAAPWVIGVLLGYILAKIKFFGIKVPKIGKPLVILLWATCVAVTVTCVFAGHSTLRGPEYDKWGNAFYVALVRPVWALCLSWVIMACVLGYGGPINTLLSLPIYQVLNRFTYSIYLLHLTILYLIGLASKRGLYFSFFNVAYSFWGITMFSFGLSVLWVLAFESPMIVIEKIIFNGFNRITSVCRRKSPSSEVVP